MIDELLDSQSKASTLYEDLGQKKPPKMAVNLLVMNKRKSCNTNTSVERIENLYYKNDAMKQYRTNASRETLFDTMSDEGDEV